jgi:hypothetical protein
MYRLAPDRAHCYNGPTRALLPPPKLHAIPFPSYEIVAKTADYFRAQHHCREALMDVSVGRRRFDERFDSHSADRPAVESRTAGRSRE